MKLGWLELGLGAIAAALLFSSDSGSEAEWIARILASEASGQTPPERAAIAYAVLNKARRSRRTVAQLSNGIGPQGAQRPWSTRQAPDGLDRQVATSVLARYPAADPTNGGTAFFEPAEQDKLYASGQVGYRYDAAGIREKWTNDGMQHTATVGRWEFWT